MYIFLLPFHLSFHGVYYFDVCREKEILREEINSLEIVKVKLRARITELEDEVRKSRTALEEQIGTRAAVIDDEVRLVDYVLEPKQLCSVIRYT